MNIKQAKSELMQIYDHLSPNKQRAIDAYINDHRQLEADNTMLCLDFRASMRAIYEKIREYEINCSVATETKECTTCNKNTFRSIYKIIKENGGEFLDTI